jgi:chemotaxis protein methyltransferase CheR
MTGRIHNTDLYNYLSKLSEFLGTQMGLHFREERWIDLLKGIRSAAKEFGFSDVETCIQWLLSSPLKKSQIEILACHLTVGETYFFREAKIFDALEKHVLPLLICSQREGDHRLRIWSAGCCTGEEPYSVAILLNRLIPDLKRWKITLLATDINPIFLQKATEGIYRDWSFRGTPAWVKENYFKRTKDDSYEIIPSIKRMVRFSYLNLVQDVYPTLFNDTNAMDLILCRNVMMYFFPDQIQKVIQRFYHSLLTNGWLIVGPSEAANAYFSQYATVNFPGAILYKKEKEESVSKGIRSSVDFISQEVALSKIKKETTISEPSSTDLREKPKLERTSERRSQKTQKKNIEVSQKQESEQNPYEEAELFYEQGYYEETKEIIHNILSENKNDAKAMTLLAKVFANQGKLTEALEWCKKAIDVDKLNPQFYHLHATILEEKGQVGEAMKSLKHAIYLNDNFVLAHFMLGNLMRQQGKFKESEKCFNNALTILDDYRKEDVLPESDGIVAGRLAEIIRLANHEDIPA